MTKTKDGYTRNPDGTISYKGQNLGNISLTKARQQAQGVVPGTTKPSGPKSPALPKGAFTDAGGSYAADKSELPWWQNQAFAGSNANTQNPFGSQTVKYDAQGNPYVDYQLSDANKNVASGIQGNAGGALGNLGQSLKGGALGNWGGATDASGAVQSDPYTKAVFSQLTQFMDPQFKQQTEDKRQELVNRGIPIGSDQYNKEMKNLSDNQQQYYSNAANQAVTSGAGIQNQSAQTLQNIGTQGYMDPHWQQAQGGWNPNMFNSPTQTGQVFGTLANQNLAAQASMVGAKAAALGANTNANLAGLAAANMYPAQGPVAPGYGTTVPTQ